MSRLFMSAGFAALALAPIQAMLAAPSQADSDTAAPVQLAQNERPKVTVLPLAHGDVSSDYWWYSSYYRGQGAARGISELLITELVNDGAYSVVDSSQVIDSSDNRIDESAAIDRAQQMNLDAVIAGTITQFDLQEDRQCVNIPFVGRSCTDETKATVQVNVRLIDPVTREIIATAEGEGDASKSGGSIDLRRGPDASSSDRRAADELLTEATEAAIEQIVPEIVSAESRF
ncbi:MAG: LPS assembly lipoprotein LptE [Cyanobacteria bacterium P01_F01_bin.116]